MAMAHTQVRITPIENPHSRTAHPERKGAKKANDMDEVLNKIKEKARQDFIDSKKLRATKRKHAAESVPISSEKDKDKAASTVPAIPEEGGLDTIQQLKVCIS